MTRWPSSCTSQQLVSVRAITSRIYALVRAGCTVMTRKSEPPHLGSMWCGTRACRSAGPSFTLNGALHLVRTHHHSGRFGPVRTAPALWCRVSPHLVYKRTRVSSGKRISALAHGPAPRCGAARLARHYGHINTDATARELHKGGGGGEVFLVLTARAAPGQVCGSVYSAAPGQAM